MSDTSDLYENYKKTSDDDIRKYLEKIKIVKLTNHGEGSVVGYYPLSDKSMAKILEKPRNNSLTFDANKVSTKRLKGVKEFKELTYLVKSSSRFFLKPDVGEIFDQMDEDDLKKTKAICFSSENYRCINGEGDHFIMTAKLLK